MLVLKPLGSPQQLQQQQHTQKKEYTVRQPLPFYIQQQIFQQPQQQLQLQQQQQLAQGQQPQQQQYHQQQQRQQQALRQDFVKLEGLQKEQSAQEESGEHVLLRRTKRRDEHCPPQRRQEAEPQHDQTKEMQGRKQQHQQKKLLNTRPQQNQKQQQKGEELQEKRARRHQHQQQHLQQEHACIRRSFTVFHFCASVVHLLFRNSSLYSVFPFFRRLSAFCADVSLVRRFLVIFLVFAFAALLEFSAAALAFTCRSVSPLQAHATHFLPAAPENSSTSLVAPTGLAAGPPHISTRKSASGTAVTASFCTNAAGAAPGDTAAGCLYPSAFSSSALRMVKHKKYQLATDNLFIGLSDAQVQRNLRRKQMAIDYRPLRQLYIQRIQLARSMDERLDWQYRLQKLPRDSSPTRYRNRCHLCGRPRGFFRFFGLCRIHVLEHIRNTNFPGFTKAEW